jgi:glucose/arabinose dehydrogenase
MSGQELTDEETLLRGFGRIRDIRQGPDGLIYLAIDAASGATLVRLEPAGGGD